MKKIITSAVLIGIAALAASPFIIGSTIESTTHEQAQIADNQLKTMAKTNPYFRDASFKIENYEKNYASGTARSLLRLETIVPDENDEFLTVEIPLVSEITHGPYLGGSDFGLAKIVSRPDLSEMELPETVTAETFTIEDIISFSGKLDETITVLPVKYDADDINIDFSGAKAVIETTTANRLNFSGNIALEDLKFNDSASDIAFNIKPIDIELQGKGDSKTRSGNYQFKTGKMTGESSDGFTITAETLSASGTYRPAEKITLSLGSQEFILTNIEVNNPSESPEPVKIPEIKVTSTTDQSDDATLDISANYSAQLDSSLMAILQSPVDVKTASIDMKINSLPTSALQTYMEVMQGATSSETTAESMGAMQEKIPGIIQSIINSATSSQLAIKADTGEGKLDADIDINFKSDEELSEEAAIALMMAANDNPAALLSVLSGEGNVHLDKSVTDKVGLTPIVQIMAADFVKLEGEVFKSALLIEDGQILINGQPLPMFAVASEEMTDGEGVAQAEETPESEQLPDEAAPDETTNQ